MEVLVRRSVSADSERFAQVACRRQGWSRRGEAILHRAGGGVRRAQTGRSRQTGRRISTLATTDFWQHLEPFESYFEGLCLCQHREISMIIDDIAYRLYWRKPEWFYGEPKISVEGEKGSWGKMIFDFQDEIVEYDIYLTRDPARLQWMAEIAIKLFVPLAEGFFDQEMECYERFRRTTCPR